MSSLGLGVLTLAVLGAAKALGPRWPMMGALFDALAMPGAILLFPWFPQGPDSARSFSYWGYAVVAVNALVYSAAWFACLRAIRRRRERRALTEVQPGKSSPRGTGGTR